MGEVEFFKTRYEMKVNDVKKYVYLLNELLEINGTGQYSQSVVEMMVREITKKSYQICIL